MKTAWKLGVLLSYFGLFPVNSVIKSSFPKPQSAPLMLLPIKYWRKKKTLTHNISDSGGSLSKDNLDKHFKYAGFGFLVTEKKTNNMGTNKLSLNAVKWMWVRGEMGRWGHFLVKSSDITLTEQEPFVRCCVVKAAIISVELMQCDHTVDWL